MANENSIDVYHALMALEEKITGVAPDPENVTTDVALALADIFRTDAPMAQETAIVNAIDTITANYGGGGGVAKVTFACTYTGDAFGIVMPLVYEGVIYTGTSSDEVDGTTFDVPVAENGTQVVLGPPTPDDLTVAVTGDITIDDEGYLMVTGDGTVTLADKGDH